MLARMAALLQRSGVRILTRYGCQSVRGLITRAEESLCVNEEVLIHLGLSCQIKYIGYERSPAYMLKLWILGPTTPKFY